MSNDKSLVAQLARRKLAKCEHRKIKSHSLVLTSTDGAVGGKNKPGRSRTAWIDNVRHWTTGGLHIIRETARTRSETGYG